MIWLLLPASLLLALLLEAFPLPPAIGMMQPPWLLLVVLYWGLHHPTRLSLAGAWLMGLMLDVTLAYPLGTHAALFLLTITPALALQRLLLALPVAQQGLWLAGLVALYELGELLLGGHLTAGGVSARDFLPLISTLFAWPLIRLLLYRPEGQLA